MKEVVAFTCDYCPKKKRFAFRWYAVLHEAKCFFNPEKKACATCDHYHRDKYDGPWCDENAFNTDKLINDGYATTPLRSNCPSWKPKQKQP